MGFKDKLRRFKPAYAIYNFFHRAKLRHIKERYKEFGLSKTYFEPVTHADFKGIKNEAPWLDQQASQQVLAHHPTFQKLDPKIQSALLNWSEDGYAILPQFFSSDEVDTINAEIGHIKDEQLASYQRGSGKLMFAVKKSKTLHDIVNAERTQNILNLLLGKEVRLFQSINFEEGSQQHTHSDSVHMTTFPLGYLIAIWIALEDIQPGSGVLHYYPGSHKLPYIMTPDFDSGSNRFFLGQNAYDQYEQKIAEVVSESTFEKKEFLPKKGDILIWHANLLHGGNPITIKGSTRKSMVLHYYAKDVACYHEITQRPALME